MEDFSAFSQLKLKMGSAGQTVIIQELPDGAQLMQPGNCAGHCISLGSIPGD